MEEPMDYQSLLYADSGELAHFLQQVQEEKQTVPEQAFWIQLSEMTRDRAQWAVRDGNISNAMTWAHMAIISFDYVRQQASTAKDKERAEYDAMRLRTFLILRLGADKHDPIREPVQIVTWFWQNCPLSVEEARELSQTLDDDTDTFLLLRHLKERLMLLESLYQGNVLAHDERIEEWISLMKSLP